VNAHDPTSGLLSEPEHSPKYSLLQVKRTSVARGAIQANLSNVPSLRQ
jgi:hypothetical protein